MSRKSSTETLIAAMRILARDIQSGDGVANAAIAEAADRLEELHADHLRDATKMVTDRRLADAVNELRDIAIKYHAADQLRERIAGVVHGLVRGEPGAVAVDAAALEALRDITAAADAVIQRWHTPLWKDARPTAEYIAALRVAAESARKLLAGSDK